MPLNPHFTKTSNVLNGLTFIRLDHTNPMYEAQLADELANYIMQSKLSKFPAHYQAWINKNSTGNLNPSNIEHFLEAIVRVSIGTIIQPKDLDHIQGWVAEHLWYYLIKGSYPLGHIVRVFDVGISSTEHGGDGFVLHNNSNGLKFRLWEIKKISGTTNVNSVIRKASNQLKNRGTEYISRFVQENQNNNLSAQEEVILIQAIEDWINMNSSVGIGISTISSSAKLRSPSFQPLVNKFPQISANGNIEGRVISLDDFDRFCTLVCRRIWNGI